MSGSEITSVAVSSNEQTLVTGNKDGRVTIWDISDGFEERETIEAFYDEDN